MNDICSYTLYHRLNYNINAIDHRFHSTFKSRKAVMNELKEANHLHQELMQEFGSVFCHADAHVLNLIYNEDNGMMFFENREKHL